MPEGSAVFSKERIDQINGTVKNVYQMAKKLKLPVGEKMTYPEAKSLSDQIVKTFV